MKSPHRGEVWLVDLGMAAKVRPALAISVPADNADRALVTMVPRSTSPPGERWLRDGQYERFQPQERRSDANVLSHISHPFPLIRA
jgi:mRNA-degrading endonuclease toxin of MazEF toxin-antitoxin module